MLQQGLRMGSNQLKSSTYQVCYADQVPYEVYKQSPCSLTPTLMAMAKKNNSHRTISDYHNNYIRRRQFQSLISLLINISTASYLLAH